MPITVERSHCLCPLLYRYEQHLHSSARRFHWLRFRRVRKVSEMIVSFFMSVCIGQIGSHWMDFCEILCGNILKSLSRSFVFGKNRTRISDTLHEDRNTFMIISPWILSGRGGIFKTGCTEN